MIQFYDAKVPWYRANIWHDLNNGDYLSRGWTTRSRRRGSSARRASGRDFQPDCAASHRHEVMAADHGD